MNPETSTSVTKVEFQSTTISVETQPGVLFNPASRERVSRVSYRDTIQERTRGQRIWDYLSYNEAGELIVNGIPIMVLIERYGTPLEIVDTTLIERRTKEWKALVTEVAGRTGYQGSFEYFYAAKANMSAEIALAAYRAGWQAETSGAQDLNNIYWLYRRGLIKTQDLKIICNGFKLPPNQYNNRNSRPKNQQIPGITFHDDLATLDETEEIQYADLIALMRQVGFEIVPILDKGELTHFSQAGEIPQMDVGLRLKFGKVDTDEALDQLESRHGLTWTEMQVEAAKIAKSDHLNLTTFHAMVGAAETIDNDTFVNSLLFGLDKYFQLRKSHPSLTHFNMGGGMVPLSTNYNHRLFLEKLMVGAQKLAEKHQQPLPTIMFEFGSFVAAESGFHAFKIIQQKSNDLSETGPTTWAIVDGGLMAAIPDMLVIDKSDFVVLAANNANSSGKLVKLGDLSCDSDGRFPPKSAGEATVLIPDSQAPTYLVFCGVGAYQEILAGIDGAHHCGLLEAPEVIIVTEASGKAIYVMPRQTLPESQRKLGYSEASIKNLRMIGSDN